MSLTKKYLCDLCRQETKPEDLRSVYWDSTLGGISRSTGRYGRFTLKEDVSATDKHICKYCIQMIKEHK